MRRRRPGARRDARLAASNSRADHVVLAIGHSARDTFADAARARRVHRGQAVLDRLPHRASAVADRPARASARNAGHPLLGAADYKLVHHAATAARSTASACARAAPWSRRPREPGRVVTNGMSQYSRNERNANAGIVVGITPEDYRSSIAEAAPAGRHRACSGTGKRAPSSSAAATTTRRAQLVGDFLAGRASTRVRQRAALVQAGRAPEATCAPTRCRRLRDRGDPRSAAGVRQADQGLRDARRGADRRRDAHVLAGAHHARRRLPEPQHARPVSRPAKARATRAASCRRPSTASRWPRRWAPSCWPTPGPERRCERSASDRNAFRGLSSRTPRA